MEEKLTPMIRQYIDIKKKHQEEILFFRMGDFYEMFFDDAKIASKILDIALTARQNDIPMCGIPYHAAENYIARLIKAGKRVAICEQLETVPSSGTIVKRDVVRIVTPGTVIDSNLLSSDDNNYLCSVYISKTEMGLAFVDLSTGDFFYSSSEKNYDIFKGEIAKFNPGEAIVYARSFETDSRYTEFIKNRNIPVQTLNEWVYEKDYLTEVICSTMQVHSLKGLGIQTDTEIIAAGSILQYLNETQKKIPAHLRNPRKIMSDDSMILDEATITNLEIIENQNDSSKNRTLFSVLNYTNTPMGRRTLERNLLQPLVIRNAIEERLNLVEFFYQRPELTDSVTSVLKEIYDMERILSRFTLGRMQTRNFISLKQSLYSSLELKKILADEEVNFPRLNRITEGIEDLEKLEKRIDDAISEEPALTPEHGRVIKEGFLPELDEIYELKVSAKNWMLKYQEEEKVRLGINTLKVKYNKILGYYIELSKNQSSSVPDYYMRKQTLVGSERYTTEKLQKFETDILSASDRIIEIEKREIEQLRMEIMEEQKRIQETASAVGYLDVITSLSTAAMQNRYVKPSINEKNYLSIKGGRHPVVEKYYTKEVFIPNDIILDDEENIISIITGPNMSGKSTYIRMCAIIQLMAQTGSFVPAESADVSIADRIFTRIGASDNISRGESTFLVEMNETAGILNNATHKSLIIMDEVGRGTSTYDGLSIAWAVVEYILRYIKAKTLFATHYHELTQLGSKKGIVNFNVLVKETINNVEFLHKVVPGSADKSYGIHVAKLAGLPGTVVSRSSKILDKLEKGNSSKGKVPESESETEQLEIFNASNHLIIQALKTMDPENMTPIEAINELNRLKKMIY